MLFFLLFLSGLINAQIFPAENSTLNYTIIGFSFLPVHGVGSYTVQFTNGYCNSVDSFKKNITTSVKTNTNKLITEVPAFGKKYTWRTVYTVGNSNPIYSPLHHFSTMPSPQVDSNAVRLRITQKAQAYKNAFVFIDGINVMYSTDGHPVWFLPLQKLNISADENIRDLKLTPQHTITFLTNHNIYEIDYNGDILWQYKNHDPVKKDNNKTGKIFHHEFTRLDNGNYMALRSEKIFRKLASSKDSIAQNADDSSRFFQSLVFTKIVEYDQNCNEVWAWRSADYAKTSDLNLYLQKETDSFLNVDIHENSFFFDEKNKNIYLGIKNINRIIKIKYPEGTVLNTYGTLYKPGITKLDNDLFCGQHSCKLSQNGYLYLFNNNMCGSQHIPQIIILEEPGYGQNNLKKIWQYDCTFDGLDTALANKLNFNYGGSVQELPDRSILAFMNTPYSKAFIVNIDKKILWSAVCEKYNTEEKKWTSVDSYRASIISSNKDLEQLIWNAGK